MLDRNLVIAIFDEAVQESRGDPWVLRDLFIEWVTAMDESGPETYEEPRRIYREEPRRSPGPSALRTGCGNRLSEADGLRAVEWYEKTGNMSKVARIMGTTPQTIAKMLDERGVQRRRNKRRSVEGMAIVG